MRSNSLVLRKYIIAYFLLLMGLLGAANAHAASDPVAMLNSIANNMISQLKANKATLKTKPQIVYNLAYRYVVPYADITEMSRRVLPPRVWNSATASQKAQFEKHFTRMLIRTYASALTSYQDQTVQFFPVRGGYAGKSSVEVRSNIVGSGSQPISVTYRMINTGGSWRLIDMSVEGVSLIQSFRSQFADILSRGNMDQLLNRISSHNDRNG